MELAALWLGRSVPTALISRTATVTSRLKIWVTKTSCPFMVLLHIRVFRCLFDFESFVALSALTILATIAHKFRLQASCSR